MRPRDPDVIARITLPTGHGWLGLAGNQAMALALDEPVLRGQLLAQLQASGPVLCFAGADHPDDDPAPPWTRPAATGHRRVHLVAGDAAVREALQHPGLTQAPYAAIGGASFMLALEATGAGSDHQRQRGYAEGLMRRYPDPAIGPVAERAVEHALVTALVRDRFDLAALGEQIGVRFCGLWFGFAAPDHGLIQAAAAAGYRALVHQIIGRHFGADATVLPQARAAMAQLTARASALLAAYAELAHAPGEVASRMPHHRARASWPEGVEPPADWGLSPMGEPLLKAMAGQPGDFGIQELATLAVGLVVGTVGNVQAALCLLMQRLMARPSQLAEARALARDDDRARFDRAVAGWLHQSPPVAFVPRRAREDLVLARGHAVAAGEDVIVWLASAGAGSPPAGCPQHGPAFTAGQRHGCIGQGPAFRLIVAALRALLALPSLAEAIHPVHGRPEGLRQRWGFACLSYPLLHQRARRLAQQPLNVVMRVKAPVELHAEAIRRVIAVGAPRIERALRESRHVHFAWFEFLDQGRQLALHTVYDGDFDAYVEHFALKVDDLFDRLFEHIEGAPPLPVAENPGAFVDVIRAHNAAPVHGYFFSAYPSLEVPDVLAGGRL